MKDVCHKVFFIGCGSYIRTQQKKRSLYQFHGYGNSVQYNNKSYAVSWSLHPFISYCISSLNAFSGYHIIYEMSTGLFHWGTKFISGDKFVPVLSPVWQFVPNIKKQGTKTRKPALVKASYRFVPSEKP